MSCYCGRQVGFKRWNQKWRGVHYPAGGPRMRLWQSTKLSVHTTHTNHLLLPLHMFLILAAWRKEPPKLVITAINRLRHMQRSSLNNSLEYCYKFIYNSKVNCLLWAAGNKHLKNSQGVSHWSGLRSAYLYHIITSSQDNAALCLSSQVMRIYNKGQ